MLRAKGEVYVIIGPVFTVANPTIGRNCVKVRAYPFKLGHGASTQRAWAH